MTLCPTCHRPMVPKRRTPFVYKTYQLVWDVLRFSKEPLTTGQIIMHFLPTAPKHTQNILTWLRKHGYVECPAQGMWRAI